MNKKSKIIMISALALLLVGALAASYAFFTANIIGSEDTSTITVTGGKMAIAYDDANPNITLSGLYPRSEAWATKTFTLSGTNSTDVDMYYKASLVIESNSFSSNTLTYTLTSTNTDSSGDVIPSITTQTGINTGTSTITLGKGKFVKGSDKVHTYELNIFFPNSETSQNSEQGKSITAYIKIESYLPNELEQSASGTLLNAIGKSMEVSTPLTTPGRQTNKYTFDNSPIEEMYGMSSYQSDFWTYGTDFIENSDGSVTLTGVTTGVYSDIYQNLVGKYLVNWDPDYISSSTNTTREYSNLPYVVRVESATLTSLTYKTANSKNTTEAVLASTPDDYGTSYYYRGAVENNYVSFAGMCWRIVRVTGNGAIKLVLYNYNPNNVSNPCDSAQDGTTNAFARYSGDTYETKFNAIWDSNAYIGFMYGTPGSSSYAEEHANTNKSTILTNLETWYNAKLSSYSSKLADTIWCNDKSTKSTYTVDGTAYGNGLGYSTNQTMYGARDRIYANNKYATGASPTLICPNDNNGGKLSKFTADDTTYGNGALTYKIGLLTADEVAFAGGIVGLGNSTYYLNKNASSTYWWSLSPIYFDGSGTVGWHVDPSGFINSDYVYNVRALRPAVSLASSTTATGTGTQANPYVVES